MDKQLKRLLKRFSCKYLNYILFLVFILLFVSSIHNPTTIQQKDIDLTSGNYGEAVFAGGCFWCSESDFEKHEGVLDAISGYAGGTSIDPTYRAVSSGQTDFIEAVKVIYDPSKISYEELLRIYWRHIDPTDDGGQFVDRGRQYTAAIYYGSEEEKTLAETSKDTLDSSGIYPTKIVTPIIPFTTFYEAEEYHQDYHIKNSLQYKYYRYASGRDQYLKSIWGNAPVTIEYTEEIEALTPLQYKVTQENGTERAFQNEYWNNKEEGIYVDLLSGEALFSSTDKYVSGTGWPSFTKPIQEGVLVEVEDVSIWGVRTEIRTAQTNYHVGHVFPDGPAPTGLRYCMNSAALKFVPLEDLEKEGYGEYLDLFDN